jgi:hypothetical protein
MGLLAAMLGAAEIAPPQDAAPPSHGCRRQGVMGLPRDG